MHGRFKLEARAWFMVTLLWMAGVAQLRPGASHWPPPFEATTAIHHTPESGTSRRPSAPAGAVLRVCCTCSADGVLWSTTAGVKAKALSEYMGHASVSRIEALPVHDGKQYQPLTPEHPQAQRAPPGRRGKPRPRGYQAVPRLEIV